jgi:hypothetical protein
VEQVLREGVELWREDILIRWKVLLGFEMESVALARVLWCLDFQLCWERGMDERQLRLL